MRMTKKPGLYLSICILLTLAIYLCFGSTAKATDIKPENYAIVANGQPLSQGAEIELTAPSAVIYVRAGSTSDEAWDPGTTVEWVSSEKGVVDLKPYSSSSNFIQLVQKGPGYSTITATVKYGTFTYTLSCVVKVDLDFTYDKTTQVNLTGEHILIFDSEKDASKQLKLKYVDYTPQGSTQPVSGGAITASTVTWESNNESVAKVDEYGNVTPVGGGSALITVTTKTVSSNSKKLSKSIRVVVSPTFTLSYTDVRDNSKVTKKSDSNRNNFTPAEGVPSSFVIESNAKFATNIKWEVYDASSNTKLSSDSKKLNYSVSENSGSVVFSNVKAGTYDIYAFANDLYTTNTNAPYAYMRIIVPINLYDEDIVMNVGDTYDIVDNSNIPDFGIFSVSYINTNNEEKASSNIAYVDPTTGIIKATSKGKVKIKLTYLPNSNLYDDGTVYTREKIINVTVIDGISLSVSQATLYTGGTLLLYPVLSDNTIPVVWESDNKSVATVDKGLVKAISPGVTVITAKQKINGVVKTAKCEITVQQSVESITLKPKTLDLAEGEAKTITATITPNLNNVTLKWKTSNEDVVKIIEEYPRSVTVEGVKGGTAVISAINQDNVVVGYCHVTVREPVTDIVLSDTKVTINLSAKSLQLRAIVYPETAQNKEVKWTSSNEQIATVNENGLVTLLKPGEVSIIATSVDNPSKMAICNISIEVPVTSIALDEKEVTMYVGESKKLTYTLLPLNATINTVTWTSTNTNVATVDSTGKVTAKQVGTTVIMVQTMDGNLTAYCTVNVRQIAENVKFAESEIQMHTGETVQLEYTLVPVNATDGQLVWESTDTKVVVVDDAGKVTAKGAGTAFVIARTEAGGMSYVKVTVTQPATGLILNFSEKTIHVKETFQLKVSVTPSEATNIGVEWKSSNTNVATVDENGQVTGIAPGTAIITCTTKDGGFRATCLVIVRERLTNMELNYKEYHLSVNKTVTLSVLVDGEVVTDQEFKWVSSNSDVASVNKNGKVKGNKVGKAVITAYAKDGSGAEASCEIEVVRPVTKITLDKTYLYMLIGETKQLKVNVEPKNATYKKPKWTIEGDDGIVIVDDDGYITALKEGSVTLKASAQDDSGKFAICYVTVSKRVPATSVIMSDKKIVMVQGETRTIRPVLNPVNSTDSVAWSTDNSAVASVNSSGKITAKATGTAYVTAMTDSGKTATVEINVIGLNVTDLVLEQYTRYTLQVEGATSKVIWDVENPEIAEVKNGVVITKAKGTTIITATVNGRKLTCKLKVTKIK